MDIKKEIKDLDKRMKEEDEEKNKMTEIPTETGIQTFDYHNYVFKVRTKRVAYNYDEYRIELEITLPNGKLVKVGNDTATPVLFRDKLEKTIETTKQYLKKRLLNVMSDFVREREEDELRIKYLEFLKTYVPSPEEIVVDKI
jgi:hypothetical protein